MRILTFFGRTYETHKFVLPLKRGYVALFLGVSGKSLDNHEFKTRKMVMRNCFIDKIMIVTSKAR